MIEAVGGEPGDDYSRRRGAAPGKDYLDANLVRYNAAARHSPWLVLRDADGACAKDLVAGLLTNPAPLMRFRIVIPAIEAWLLADREAIADFLGVEVRRLPRAPEQISDVKTCVIALARRSSVRQIREAMLPDPRSARREGPGYAISLTDFIVASWQPQRAAQNAESLRRAIDRLASVVKGS